MFSKQAPLSKLKVILVIFMSHKTHFNAHLKQTFIFLKQVTLSKLNVIFVRLKDHKTLSKFYQNPTDIYTTLEKTQRSHFVKSIILTKKHMTVQKRKVKSVLKISNQKKKEPRINRSINFKVIKERKTINSSFI